MRIRMCFKTNHKSCQVVYLIILAFAVSLNVMIRLLSTATDLQCRSTGLTDKV